MSIKNKLAKLSLLLSLSMAPAVTVAHTVFFGGSELSEDSSYVFLGGVKSLNNNLGNGPVVKGWVDWLSYNYTANDTEYTVSGPGLELAFGYIKPVAKHSSVAGYLGMCYRDANEDPANSNNDVDYKECGKAQIEFNSLIDQQLELQLISSYITTHAYWNRMRLIFPSRNHVRFGFDTVFQGDRQYKAYQVGGVISGFKLSNASLSIKLGARKAEGSEVAPYIGFEVVK